MDKKWVKTSAGFPNFADFEGQHLHAGEVKELVLTQRVSQALREGYLEEVAPPVEESTEGEVENQDGESPESENIKTASNVRRDKSKGKS